MYFKTDDINNLYFIKQRKVIVSFIRPRKKETENKFQEIPEVYLPNEALDQSSETRSS